MIIDIILNIAKYCDIGMKIEIKKCQKQLNDYIKIYKILKKKTFISDEEYSFHESDIGEILFKLQIIGEKLSNLLEKMRNEQDKLNKKLKKKILERNLNMEIKIPLICNIYIREDKTIDYYAKENTLNNRSIINILWDELIPEEIGKKNLKNGKFYI